MTPITMPRLSDSMQEGTIVRWLVADGASVARGDELLEIETDKATMAYESEVDGVVAIVAPEGATVAVGDVIARIGGGAAAPVAATPEPREGEPPAVRPSENGGGPPVAVLATPVARRLAAAHGVALEGLGGTGPGGRITKTDVALAAGIDAPGAELAPTVVRAALPAAAPGRAGMAEPVAADGGGARGAGTVVELSRAQQLIARRMAQAKATIPDFQVQTETVMDDAVALRSRLRDAVEEGQDAPSLNDLIVKACATALRRHPRVNGSFVDGHFELHERVNVGVAVAAGDALIVPTIFDADAKSLGAIAREGRALAEAVRSGTITPPQLGGATFTVSNLGMYGMTAITPVVNPPQAAILGVGALRGVLARVDGEIVDQTLMTLTLSCDHRILYGADAARFLSDVAELLQSPLRLLL